jgi:hypothetical protein
MRCRGVGVRVGLVLSLAAACATEPPVPTSIRVSETSVTLDAIGATHLLTAEVLDQRGRPLPAETVSWTSRTPSVVTVSSSGLLTAVGNGNGEVRASSGTLEAMVAVTVAQAVAALEGVSGDGQVGEAGAPLPAPLVVRARDRLGVPVAGASVRFEVLEGGGSVAPSTASTDAQGRASAVWTLGAAGVPQQVRASHAESGRSVFFTATSVEPNVPTAVAKVSGDGQVGLVGTRTNERPAVRVLNGVGAPVAGVTVTFTVIAGGGSVEPASSVTGTDGIASTAWTLGPAPGPNGLRAAVAGVDSVEFSATGATAAFDVDVRPLTSMTATQQQAFLDAAARWEALIFGDLPDLRVVLDSAQLANCVPGGPPGLDEVVDDVIIFARVDSIDGPGSVLGRAGPCFVRQAGLLPVLGVMVFDEADLGNLETSGHLDEVILHEMGHVLGIGSLWPLFGLLTDPDTNDPIFTGPRAIAAFDRIGGASYSGRKVPVEGTPAPPGTRNAHWRESVLRTELMTGFLNAGVPNPLSELSVASLWDLGYQVVLAAADPFVLPSALRAAGTPEPLLSLKDDILPGPVYVLDGAGRVVGVLGRW